ncbi:hypothetical protein GCM10023205_68350 [Yinghuangia aomiensis]|uniref:Lipoprotein n=1 Tax=Yinghuangia aomiensis TaxID=676205 RepID=A0ABP9I558_9ACTN
MRRLRHWYGAGPLNLLALAACFALAGYAATRLLTYEPARVIVWFIGAAVVHDLVLFPLYSTADTAVQAAASHPRDNPKAEPARPGINYVRFPAFVSAVLFLVWFPLILQRPDTYKATTALDPARFMPHWLLITAGLFAASALAYAVVHTHRRRSQTLRRRRRHGRTRVHLRRSGGES